MCSTLRLFVAAILLFATFYSDAIAQEQPNIIVIQAADMNPVRQVFCGRTETVVAS
jgi:hypothetical protein